MSAFRAGMRSGAVSVTLAGAVAHLAARRLRYGTLTLQDRAAWLQETSRQVLRNFGVTLSSQGTPPAGGLLVSNHLSYLDALVYAALMPATFISKHEVQGWPLFGQLATMAGTIFVRRKPRDPNLEAISAIEQALAAGITVVLFPEGSSTDGKTVLRFHSRFFEPAVRAHLAVTAAALAFRSQSAPESQLAYYGADVFFPHLLRTLGQDGMEARVVFAKPRSYQNRKQAAAATHTEVECLRSSLSSFTLEHIQAMPCAK